MAEEKEEDFNPFGSINLDELEELGNLIPDELDEIIDEAPEELEETQEELEEDKEGKPSSQDIKDSSLFTPYAKLLVEEGIAPNLDLEKFDGTPEGLLKAIQNEIQLGIDTYKTQNLDPRVKWLQDNLEQGIPLEELLAIDKQAVQLDKISEEVLSSDEQLQKNIIQEYYKETTQFSEDYIKKAIDRLEATGELKDEATSMLTGLKQINQQKQVQLAEQSKLQAAQAKKQQEEVLNNFKTTLEKTDEIVSGIKLNTLMRDKIYKTMTTPVDIDQATGTPLNKIAKARMEDPINFEIKLAYLFEATNGFKDWSVFKNTGKKAAFEELENAAKKLDARSGGYRQTLHRPQGDENLANEIYEMFGKRN